MDSKEAQEIKSVINSLLISNPLRSTLQQLWRDFQDMEGRPCPVQKFGFTNFEEFLRAIPETVQVFGSGPHAEVQGIVSTKTEHINEMVLKQKKPSKAKKNKMSQKPCPRTRYSRQNHCPNKWMPPVYTPPVVSVGRPILKSWSQPTRQNSNIPKNNSLPSSDQLLAKYKQALLPQKQSQPVPIFTPEIKLRESQPQISTWGAPQIQQNVQNIQSSLYEKFEFKESLQQKNTKELPKVQQNIQDIQSYFEEKMNTLSPRTETCCDNYGFTFEDNRQNYPDIGLYDEEILQKAIQPSFSGKFEGDVAFSQSNEKNTPAIEDRSSVPVKVQTNLKTLIQQFPDGIECSKLATEYRNMFNKKIYFLEYSYRSIIEMCSDLPHIFQYVQQSSDDYILYDTDTPLPTVIPKQEAPPKDINYQTVVKRHILEEIPNINLSTICPLIPADIMTASDVIHRIFPNEFIVGMLVDVSIGEIYDPSKFWFYITFGDLEPLMKEMQEFFRHRQNRYLISEVFLEVGLPCITLFADQYHRCTIVNMMEDMPYTVRVFFPDYGTISNVSTDTVWFLPKKFGAVPGQAIRARLSSICPVYKKRPWSALAVARFEKLIAKRAFVAEVTHIDEQDFSFEFYLADITEQENIFYINDVLVKEGYARYLDEPSKLKNKEDHDCTPFGPLYTCPEFKEIEQGIAPTIEEMHYIFTNKIPMHHYFPALFSIFYKENIQEITSQHEYFNSKDRTTVVISTTTEDESFDLSIFSDSLMEEVEELYEQGYKPKRSKPHITIKTQPCSSEAGNDTKIGKSDSVKEYFCNKKRITELMNGNTSNDKSQSVSKDVCDRNLSSSFSTTSISDITNSSYLSQEIVPLNDSFEQLNLNNNNNPSRLSTNPFRNPNSNNPFRSTNPFLSDLEEGANFRNLFTKSPEDVLPNKIVNNLRNSHWSCKSTNEVNKNNTLSNTSVEPTSNVGIVVPSPPRLPSRVRTPPGFSSGNVQSGPPFQPNLPAYNYTQHNPYYNRFPNAQFYPNTHFPQNPMFMDPGQPYCNNPTVPPMVPHQFSFTVSNWQHFFGSPNFYQPRPRFS